MTEIQQRQLAILEDTAKHFNSTNRSTDPATGFCRYAGLGCAIGRLIPDKELCAELDGYGTVDQPHVFNRLPTDLKELGVEFLRDLQYFHDCKLHWDEYGMSLEGKRELDRIKKRFELQNFHGQSI